MREVKTKFDATNKFKNVMDIESTRYALGSTHVMQTESDDEVYLTATNGRIMAVNRVSGHTDETRLVPGSVMPTKLKGGNVELNGKWMNDSGKYADPMDEGHRFPKTDQVLPILSAESHILLHLDAKLLSNLCEAIVDNQEGSHNIVLAIDTADIEIDENDNYRHVSGAVTVIGQKGRFGVIMPMTHGECIPARHAEQCADYRRAFEQRGTVATEESEA